MLEHGKSTNGSDAPKSLPSALAGRRPFSVVTKPAGAGCNLDCSYCFFLSKELLYNTDSQAMSPQGLERYIRQFLAAQPDGEVTFNWQGGEPTLRGLEFFQQASKLAKELARPGQQVLHTLQTNGTLLTDAWGEFLAREKFLVGISFDGPARLHDVHRLNRGGRGTHDMVMRGWKILEKYGVERNVLCTVNSANEEYPKEVYDFFVHELKAQYIQFIPIVERVEQQYLDLAERGWRTTKRGQRSLLYVQQGGATTSRSVNPEKYGSFMSSIFKIWATRDVGSVFIQSIEAMLSNLFGRYTLCVQAPQCGNALAVEYNGDIYACDHFVEPAYKRGNLKTTDFVRVLMDPEQAAFGKEKLSNLPSDCIACPVRWACHGGCPKDRFVAAASTGPERNYLCPGYFSFYSTAAPAVQAIARLLQAGRPATEIMDPMWQKRLFGSAQLNS